MNAHRIANISAAISYIEAHLCEKLDLETVASAVSYSKYHLHRMFTATAGLPLHAYIRRRRLTEAARLLVCTGKPLLEVALDAGFESQQAFAVLFKAMYKQTPLAYRKMQLFYPLQLPFAPDPGPSGSPKSWHPAYAAPPDLPDWMHFTALVIGGFPRLDASAHRAQAIRRIAAQEALIVQDNGLLIGAAAFSRPTGHIEFLAVHPQYQHSGVAESLLNALRRSHFPGRPLTVATFRRNDKADTGQRAAYQRLGFTPADLLTEYGYPTQRLILPPEQEAHRHG